jgi:two-component system, OmpR family, sensor histidine kinase KdpD
MDESRGARPGAYLVWIVVLATTTLGLVALRGSLDKSHVALAYLLVVLIGTASIGRRGGIALAVLSFICFNFFLLPPYHTFAIADRRDWLVLLAFLITSLIAAEMLSREQRQAAAARQRSEEITRLAALGAETLSVGRAEDATQAIARVVQSTLNLGACEIFEAGSDDRPFRAVGYAARAGYDTTVDARVASMFDYAIEQNAAILERVGGAVHALTNDLDGGLTQTDARVIVLPLRVRDTGVGLLRLSDTGAIRLNEAQRRFAEALAYYAALGVERVRLTAEAERVEALREANVLKDALIAAVSHDLRTPLTTIKGLAEELGRSGDDRARTIEIEADRLNRLVADLLDLSRMRAGGFELQPEINAVEDLVGAALNQISRMPRANDLRVVTPNDVVLGHFDFVHSLRALVNLLENALKYSPPGSPVELYVEREDGFVTFDVMDRGPGIPRDETERVFEPFVRASNVDRSASGAGLGLSIAQGLAAQQGGAVRYQPRPDGGSIFTLSLPAADLPPRDS